MEPILSTYRHGSVSARVKLTKFLPWVTNKSQEAADQNVIEAGASDRVSSEMLAAHVTSLKMRNAKEVEDRNYMQIDRVCCSLALAFGSTHTAPGSITLTRSNISKYCMPNVTLTFRTT